MMQIKIISGVYGYRPPKSKQIQPAHAGDVIPVSDKEAARLIKLGVAIAVNNAPLSGALNDIPTGEPPDSMPEAPVLQDG